MSKSIYATPQFYQAVAERAIRTFAQSAVAMLGGEMAGIMDTDWAGVGSVAGMAAIMSIMMSFATAATGSGIAIGPETVDTPLDDDPKDAGVSDEPTHRAES